MPKVNACRLFQYIAGEFEECFHAIVMGAEYKRCRWKIKWAGLITLGIALVSIMLYSSVAVAKSSKVTISLISCMAANPFPWGAALFGLSLLALQILAFSLMIKK